MHTIIRTILFFLLSTSYVLAQEEVDVSGIVSEYYTDAPLKKVTVLVKDTDIKTSTDSAGRFSISLPKGRYVLNLEYDGYEAEEYTITLESDTLINCYLTFQSVELDQIDVSASKKDITQGTEMSVENILGEQLRKIPQFLGEVDVVRSIQLLPGVSNVGEGAMGFNVRGGGIDQNLLLMDNGVVYSSSHLFGFFSVFQPDVVENVQLYKGGVPAQYGGRISSVLNVTQKKGSRDGYHGNGGLGIVSSRLMLNGPLGRRGEANGGWVVAFRRSYVDLFGRLSNDETINSSRGYFYDFNVKMDYDLNSKNSLSFTGYKGMDVFGYADNFSFNWGNVMLTSDWLHTHNDNVFSKTTVNFSNYNYVFSIPDYFDWVSDMQSVSAKYNLTNYHKGHTIKGGMDATCYWLQPTTVAFADEKSDTYNDIRAATQYAIEAAPYIGDEWEVNENISVNLGLRSSLFWSLGKTQQYEYEPGVPKSYGSVVDTVHYGTMEPVQFYGGLEPRISARFKIDSVSSVKTSYNRQRQYIHRVSNTNNGLPIDVWQLSGKHLRPLVGDQVAVGYFRNIKDNMFHASLEVYYKWMHDVVDYKNGADLILNDVLETELLQGNGRAYGMEFMIRKDKGDFTGWMSYTLSRTAFQIQGNTAEETINNGEWFPASFDKTHDFSLLLSYDVSEEWSISTNFIYATGRPVTMMDGMYLQGQNMILNYSQRNQSRLPDYHRLDVSFDYKKANQSGFESSWSFSFYNVYARRNAYAMFAEHSSEEGTTFKRLSILGIIVPAVTYNFEF